MPNVIEVAGLSKKFTSRASTTWALREITFAVKQGSRFTIVGKNGSGKTTLLKILATLILPTEGSARVAGFDVARQSLQVRRNIGIAWPEEHSFYWRLTGAENLFFFGRLYGLSKQKISQRVAQLKNHFELNFLDRPVFGYSSGMRQRLNLARAFLPEAPILLLDEPLRSLDGAGSDALEKWLEQERTRGKTIVATTQRLEETCSAKVFLP